MQDISRYQRLVQEANCEEWELHLRSITFQTKYLALSTEEAKAFREVNNAFVEKLETPVEALECLKGVAEGLQKVIDETEDWKARSGLFFGLLFFRKE